MLQRRLEPFRPASALHFHVIRAPTLDVLGVDDAEVYEEYGFKADSMQYNFFRETHKTSHFVAVLYEQTNDAPPTTMTSDNVVTRLFGSVTGSDMVIWYVGARKLHPLNDSDRGKRWGVFGIGKIASTSSNVRWQTEKGGNITKRNSEGHIRGSPNPYALRILIEVAHTFSSSFVVQNPDMPCAKLFHKDYDHSAHPATLLLYRTLGFVKPPDLEHYIWNALVHPPLERSYTAALERMAAGLPVIG